MVTATSTGGRVIAVPGPAVSKRARQWRNRLVVLSFMAPVLIGLCLFLVYPLLASVYFSFTRFTIDNPPRLNAMTRAMLADLAKLWDELEASIASGIRRCSARARQLEATQP